MLRRYRALFYGFVGLIITITLTVGAWNLYERNARQLRIGDVRIDPLATIDPAKQYTVVIWEHDLFIPGLTTERRRNALEAAAAELAENYPNIAIQIEYRDPQSIREELQQALEAGVGPDVVAIQDGFLVDPSRQIPVTPYISDEARADIIPSVQTALELNGHLWAWPRWISMPIWLGRENTFQDIPGLPGLSSAQLFQRGTVWRSALGNRPPIALNAFDADLFYGMIVSSTGLSMISNDGTIQWSQESIEQVGETLHNLMTDSLVSGDVETIARSRLRLFWEGQASIIAPATYPLLHHAFSRIGEIMHDGEDELHAREASELRIVSPPFSGDHLKGMAGHVAGYAVLLRENHPGDDHTAAVMFVAQHLSRRAGYWEAANMLTVPTHASSLSQWERDSGIRMMHVQSLIELAGRLVAPPVESQLARLQHDALGQTVQPHVLSLLQGGLTPKQFADAVWRDLHAFVSARTGK